MDRHCYKHKGEVFNGKPCESYTFPRVKNRLQLDAVCSSSRPTNPPTTNNKRLDTVMQNHVIAETRLNDLLWLIESKLAMDKTLGLHFYVSATPSRLLLVNQRKVSSTLFGWAIGDLENAQGPVILSKPHRYSSNQVVTRGCGINIYLRVSQVPEKHHLHNTLLKPLTP